MIKTSIEIDDLRDIESRRIELPTDTHFSLTVAFLINDFAKRNNVDIEDILMKINEDLEFIKKLN